MNKYFSVNTIFKLLFLMLFLTIVFSGCVTQNVYPPTESTPQNLPVFLTAIEVFPDGIDLEINESLFISLITAYYSNSSTKSISPDNCQYFSNNPLLAAVSPMGLITGISAGTAIVSVIYTENSISKIDTIVVNITDSSALPAELNYITVMPAEMNLKAGETQAINSITAFYKDNTINDIDILSCAYSSVNPDVATVSSSGNVSAISEGSTIITVSYTENNTTETDTIEVNVGIIENNDVVYRALCVGIGDYIQGGENDLSAPPYDVDKMIQVFNNCKFGTSNTTFSIISYLKDLQATKSNILQSISSTFMGADSNDVSYFYFSGHGSLVGNESYICPADITFYTGSAISTDELESALSSIPGTKVVLLDTCHSGGFIGKGQVELSASQEKIESFNENIINVFSQQQPKALLTSNQYKVLTSCHYYQYCYELIPEEGDPFGVFTMALISGCGYYGNYPADTNLDTRVSLQEAYLFVKDWVSNYNIYQDVQVFPDDSSFTIVEY